MCYMEMSSPVVAVVGEGEWPIDEGVLLVRLKNSEALKSLLLVLRHLDKDKRQELVSLIKKKLPSTIFRYAITNTSY